MKRIIICMLLAVTFGVFAAAQPLYKNPDLAWGFSIGGAHGNNHSTDRWGMQYRGFFQFNVVSPMLLGQVNLAYAELSAPNVYSAQTGIIDGRILFSPFTLTNLNPYVYGGLGITKALNSGASGYLPLFLVGIGIQTRISGSTLLVLDGGYNLSLSDKFDGIARSSTNVNSFTNQKQDGFYGFSAGLAFSFGNYY